MNKIHLGERSQQITKLGSPFSLRSKVEVHLQYDSRGLKAKKHWALVENITWEINRKQWDAILETPLIGMGVKWLTPFRGRARERKDKKHGKWETRFIRLLYCVDHLARAQ